MNRPYETSYLGNLPELPALLGMDTPCGCGHIEFEHETLQGESGRCAIHRCDCRRYAAAETPRKSPMKATAANERKAVA